MELWVTDRKDVGTLGDVLMTINDFIDIKNHPFIASRKFKKCHITIDERIPANLFSEVSKFVLTIPMNEEVHVTKNNLTMICKMLPSRAAIIRHMFYSDKDNVDKFVNDLIGEIVNG